MRRKLSIWMLLDILALILTTVFIVLKVCNIITFSWFLVFLPLITILFVDILVLIIFFVWLRR